MKMHEFRWLSTLASYASSNGRTFSNYVFQINQISNVLTISYFFLKLFDLSH